MQHCHAGGAEATGAWSRRQDLPQPSRTIRIVSAIDPALAGRAQGGDPCRANRTHEGCRLFVACGPRPASVTKSSRSSAGRVRTRLMSRSFENVGQLGWDAYGVPTTTIVTSTRAVESACRVGRRRVGVFPGDAAERRRRSVAVASDRRGACAAGGRWPQGRRADGEPAARQRRRPDHVRPGDRARAAADAVVRALHAGARRPDAAQPDPRHGEGHHRRVDEHGRSPARRSCRPPSGFAARAARIAASPRAFARVRCRLPTRPPRC